MIVEPHDLATGPAQNRIARILMAGRGLPADPKEAIRWHIIAKAAGAGDPELDYFASKQPKDIQEAAQKDAEKWLSTMAALTPNQAPSPSPAPTPAATPAKK